MASPGFAPSFPVRRRTVKVRLNDFSRRWAVTGPETLAAVGRVGESGRFVLGGSVTHFESQLAAFWGLGHAVGVGSGLDALEIALRALGVAAGQRVLTTPLSAFASTLAILRLGAAPVFVDVDGSGGLDLDLCRDLLRRDSSLRCLLPVHLYGHPLDLDALESLARELELTVVEDCAQSIGASWRDRRTGSVGQAAATSFYPTKNLGALGDGGALLTSSAEVAGRARALRHYGQSATYAHDLLGLNSRLDEIHAAILADVFLPRLETWTRRRRQVAARYRAEIAHAQIEIPPLPPDADSCWHLFPLLVAGERRQGFIDHLRRCGVETAVHYPRLITEQRALLDHGRFEIVGTLERARRFAAGEVSLPIHPFLADDEIAHVIAACNQWRSA
jgi:dTDP-3-amino-3,4,6-trideoxy-alpha-D-glucose transaminase